MESRSVLRKLLSPKRVVIRGKAADKWDAIRQLIDKCVESGDVPAEERDVALKAVYEREQRSSTGLGQGFAVPHGVHDGVPTEFGALGVFPDGVDFDGASDEPSKLVLMLLYPWEARQDHVINLATAIERLSNTELVEPIPTMADPQDAYKRLACSDGD